MHGAGSVALQPAVLAPMLGEPAGSIRCVAGGAHRAVFKVECARGVVFLKCGAAEEQCTFAAEAAGLMALSAAGAVRTPQVLTTGCVADTAFLALEWIELRAGSSDCEARLGESLATLHRASAASFGWDRDNTIGASAQYNDWCPDWIEFFAEQSLSRAESLQPVRRILCAAGAAHDR